MENKKKPNVIIFTLFMIVVFFVITQLIIWGYGSDKLFEAITNYPQGKLVLGEAILASLVLIVMLLFKNSYVFTQPHKKFSKGLFYGLFYIIISVIAMITFSSGFKSGLSLLNLAVGCLLIGITEEFLCRGWLLNEFLERYGNSKKGIWYSIIISGVIFGLMHIGNINNGQDIPTTIMQVGTTAATGIILGLIYYKTKNIWTVIFLHGLWDFSLFLKDLVPVSSIQESTVNFSTIGIIFLVMLIVSELLNIIPYVKDIDAEPQKGKVILFTTISVISFLVFSIVLTLSNTKFGETYNFDNISIKEYSIIRDNYDSYYIRLTKPNILIDDVETNSEERYDFVLSMNDSNNLVFTNENTKYSTEIVCEELSDYTIMEEKDYYILAYVDYTTSTNHFLNYVYIYKSDLSNSNDFINNVKLSIKKHLLSAVSELLIIGDRENNVSYLAAYNVDYGYYLLKSDGNMSILNRD